MDASDYLKHQYHIEDYWKDFIEKLEKRKSNEEINSLFIFEISIQKNKLNRYKAELNSNYTENTIVISEQETLVNKLKNLYKQFNNNGNITKIAPIELAYDSKNKQVVKVLHEILYPKFIKCSFNEFNEHFSEKKDFTPIKWLKTETAIVDLFKKQIKTDNDDWATIIVDHFLNRSGKKFKRDQIISVGSNRIDSDYKDSNFIKSIYKKINNL